MSRFTEIWFGCIKSNTVSVGMSFFFSSFFFWVSFSWFGLVCSFVQSLHGEQVNASQRDKKRKTVVMVVVVIVGEIDRK